MTETERSQIKGALLKCAEENENKFTLTGHIVVSSLCKSAVERIAELEKENAELRNIAEFQQSSNMNRYFENKKLKDENTGLKEKLNMRSCQNYKHNNKSCPNDGSCVHYNKWEDYKNSQLTKAKEIIKTFLGFTEAFGYSPSMDKFISDTKQFLREVSE